MTSEKGWAVESKNERGLCRYGMFSDYKVAENLLIDLVRKPGVCGGSIIAVTSIEWAKMKTFEVENERKEN